jgi:hypothetical protein
MDCASKTHHQNHIFQILVGHGFQNIIMAVKEQRRTQPFYTIFLLRQMENKKYITGTIYEKICIIYEVMAQWLNTVHCPAVCMDFLWIGNMQGQGNACRSSN